MLKLKSKNPIVGLFASLALMCALFMMLEGLRSKAPEAVVEEMPEPVVSFLSEESLAPFKDRWSQSGDAQLMQAYGGVVSQLKNLQRRDLFGSLAVQIEAEHLEKMPQKYIGQLVALKFENAGEFLADKSEEYLWRRLRYGDREIEVLLLSPYTGREDRPVYMEFFFLGESSSGATQGEAGANIQGAGSAVWRAVALELHELPEGMLYPHFDRDELAFDLIVDDMSSRKMQKMTREVSALAFSHFMAQVQLSKGPQGWGERKFVDVNYSELMSGPEKYRGQLIEFTGTLIFKKKNRLTNQGLPPGLDVYEEGYVLDSDRILYVFRMPEIPRDIQLKDVIRVRGIFMQRFNFLNRMNKATWAPLMVASECRKLEEKKFGFTASENRMMLTLLLILGLGFTWLVLRKPRIEKKLHIKRSLKPKVSSGGVSKNPSVKSKKEP